MRHKFGDCSFCDGEVKEDKVELDYRYQRKLFIFRNVPAGVCQCGEKYLTTKVVKEIEQKIRTREKWVSVSQVSVNVFPDEVTV